MKRRSFTRLALASGAVAATGFGMMKPAEAGTSALRNIVLVHGAYADGSSWSEVIPRLQACGLSVTSAQNPLTSLADDVAAVRRILDLQTGPTLLVGHSWAGTVICESGTHPQVAALGFVSARGPDAGEDYGALAGQFPTPPASAGVVRQGGFAWLGEEAFLHDFANGVDRNRARVLYAVQGRIADSLFASRTTVAAWRSRPTSYLVTSQDRTTAPELQRFVARRMGARTTEIAAGHLSMISHPVDVTNFILEAARRGAPK
ncbi:alpha/beta fold hydrolase [Actinoplanes solisilvae]|uniref:alpha/beta fold hydrolase n=1 Tax=Actinoplanes solisilvae TaxID=2486853 RepID=UPI000FDC4EF7|nr:alpha/beta hydrolase [Actinoplanes solisilvae]